jgi:PiT family inorganic phosphate transporter
VSIPALPAGALIIVGFALVFDFLNGLHDSSNVVATLISSRAMGPRRALLMTAAAEAAGPFLFGVAVATTIGHEIVGDEAALQTSVIVAALVAAIGWNVATWLLGIPSSSSHTLVGGIIGAAVAASGWQAIRLAGLEKVLLALFLSPPLGLIAGFLIVKLIYTIAVLIGASPRINWWLRNGQTLTALTLALSHGTNDAQKTMGIITLGLLATGVIDTFAVPVWVIAISAGAIALGTYTGGWRLIRTLGGKFYTIRPIHGFSAQAASAAIILGAALLGGPVSTTQVVSTAIMGAGSAERFSMVRWGVAGEIVTAWFLTIPASAAVSALLYVLISRFGLL